MNNSDIADLRYLSMAEWISGDYNEFVKKTVVPFFTKSYNLKLREIRVLNAIAASGSESPTASFVSDVLRQDPATITRSLVILIGKGFVVSEEDFSDGRSRILKPTEKGKAAASHFVQIFSEIIEKAAETSDTYRFQYDNRMLVKSLEVVAHRARELRDSQRMLRRVFKPSVPAAFN
ncbi:MarR family winged helix-turn-helix transcriptional regulator [Hellea sp.]|nr:MarR family winged helix-turn-helix transcriptional regulator [Hellea sp.]